MLRISLRQLLILMAAIALALVSLKYASPMWSAALGVVTMITALAAMLGGIFDRGSRQASAVGMALTMLCYGLLLINWFELRPQLPTTQLIYMLHSAMAKANWLDYHGIPVPEKDAGAIMWNSSTGAYNLNGITVTQQISPDVSSFQAIGQYWWALLFGLIGGHIAQFTYRRRMQDSTTSATKA